MHQGLFILASLPCKAPLYSGGLGDESPNVPPPLSTLNPSRSHPSVIQTLTTNRIPGNFREPKNPARPLNE